MNRTTGSRYHIDLTRSIDPEWPASHKPRCTGSGFTRYDLYHRHSGTEIQREVDDESKMAEPDANLMSHVLNASSKGEIYRWK